MDEISGYIILNWDRLMNDVEKRAYENFILQLKVDATKGTKIAEFYQRFISNEPEVIALVEQGYDQFLESVRERVIREDEEKKYLNYCPVCKGLTRTPTAKQCPKCFYAWHETF